MSPLDDATAAQGEIIDAVAAGEQQPESDHAFTGESTRSAGGEGIHWRSATGWFSPSTPGRVAGPETCCLSSC